MASSDYAEFEVRELTRSRRRMTRRRGAVLPGPGFDDEVLRSERGPGAVRVDESSGSLLIELKSGLQRPAALVSVDAGHADLHLVPPVVNVRPRAARAGVKRAFDFTAVALTIPVWAPLLAVLALFVRLTSRGPAFYRHERVGQHGAPLRCLKLRTMVRDADSRLLDLLGRDPDAAREFAESHKIKNDPRITRFGRFLRRTSLDELPQLVNVLHGEMSLVGPRPVTRGELDRFGPYVPVVLSARPGMTGLWQISGRSDLAYSARVALDVEYTFDQCLGLDLAILARTVTYLLQPSHGGAY